MVVTFDIDSMKDDAGVWEFWARRDCDFDENGIPYSDILCGYGETESEALLCLINKLDEFGESLTDRK